MGATGIEAGFRVCVCVCDYVYVLSWVSASLMNGAHYVCSLLGSYLTGVLQV